MNIKKKILITSISFVLCLTIIGGAIYFNVKPTIKINGDKNVVLNLNDEYKEAGSTATILGKNVSEDIKIIGSVDTKKVGTYEIKYHISNKLIKNKKVVTRTINVIDNINPEIKLTGEKVSIYVGDKYTEPGYSANDNYDGDITKNVIVSNSIDNTKVGKYEVTYTVTDS